MGIEGRTQFGRTMITKLDRLLWMRYTTAELADELGITGQTVRNYCKRGAPHERDASGRIWVVGTEFAEWVREAKEQARRPCGPGQAFCLRCQAAVDIVDPVEGPGLEGRVTVVTGTCPICGARVCIGVG